MWDPVWFLEIDGSKGRHHPPQQFVPRRNSADAGFQRGVGKSDIFAGIQALDLGVHLGSRRFPQNDVAARAYELTRDRDSCCACTDDA